MWVNCHLSPPLYYTWTVTYFFLLPFYVLFRTEDPCDTKECPFYSDCTLDENFEAQCTCVRRCPLVFDPVCASDGETYPNECVFKIRACALNGSLFLLHQGYCSECSLIVFFSQSFSFCNAVVRVLDLQVGLGSNFYGVYQRQYDRQ